MEKDTYCPIGPNWWISIVVPWFRIALEWHTLALPANYVFPVSSIVVCGVPLEQRGYEHLRLHSLWRCATWNTVYPIS
ncbi:MAG: hypothetical protein IPP22_10000 [Nitrosomonas sp.]|nr:hypothetical protein [Nitrosomonas sp.]